MRNDKILIIGAGFISSKIVEALKAHEGVSVEVVDLSTGFDIRTKFVVAKKIKDFKGDKVLLMAAISDLNVFHADPQNGFAVNIDGTWNVAKACMDNNKSLYYISTCCVYGNTSDLPSSEASRPEPSEIYAACKLAGENIIKGLHKSYGLTYNILRIATTYGPNMRDALAPAVFIKQARKDLPITIHGDGRQTRTMTYIDDEVEGIVTVLLSDVFNATWNISTEESISVNEMVKIITEEVGLKNPIILHTEDRIGQTYSERIDASKINNFLGWEATTSFREGIRKTLKHIKDQEILNG